MIVSAPPTIEIIFEENTSILHFGQLPDKLQLWLSALVSKAQDIVDVSKLLDILEYFIAP